MEAAAVSRSACRAALPSRAPLRSRVAACPRRAPPLSASAAAPGRRLVVHRAAGDGKVEAAQEELPIEKRFPPFPSVMDINQIREILPHRFPFLLVDRVIEYKPGEYAVGIKNVTINDNFFPGHFPERPIMPGVLMVESGRRLATILYCSRQWLCRPRVLKLCKVFDLGLGAGGVVGGELGWWRAW